MPACNWPRPSARWQLLLGTRRCAMRWRRLMEGLRSRWRPFDVLRPWQPRHASVQGGAPLPSPAPAQPPPTMPAAMAVPRELRRGLSSAPTSCRTGCRQCRRQWCAWRVVPASGSGSAPACSLRASAIRRPAPLHLGPATLDSAPPAVLPRSQQHLRAGRLEERAQTAGQRSRRGVEMAGRWNECCCERCASWHSR